MTDNLGGRDLVNSETDAGDNPFEKLRTRTIILWGILGTLVLFLIMYVGLAVLSADPVDPASEHVLATIAPYIALGTWIVWACDSSGIEMPRLVGRVPAGYDWRPMLGLLVAAMVFSFGSWYVTAYGVSRVAPVLLERVSRWTNR